MTKISALTPLGDGLAVGDQFIIRDIDDAVTPNKSVTISGITRGLEVGTALAPSIAFAADKNTGIYGTGSDVLALVTAGENRLYITSGGLVGIGTTSPSENGLVTITETTNARLYLTDSTLGNTYGAQLRGYGVGAEGGYAELGVVDANTYTKAITVSPQADSIIFSKGATARAKIDSSGRLLVGTTTSSGPGSTLQVRNDASAAVMDIFRSDAATGTSIFGLNKSRGTAATPLEVADNDVLGYIAFRGYDGTTYQDAAYIHAACDGTWTDGGDTSDNPGRLVFSTTADGASSPTEAMRISNNRSVGIGVTDPAAGASATSGVAFRPSSHDVWFNHANGVGSETAYAYFSYNSGAIGTITQNGTTAVAYNTTSDYRLKENVAAVADGITRLKQLKPCKFNFIAEPGRTVDGFIAHEAAEVVPECVTGEKDAEDDDGNPIYQGIDQSKLVPLLTAALQEAIGEIESLKARLTAAGI